MKTSVNNQNTAYKGTGYLIGSVLTLAMAILEFVITENFVISVTSVPIGITMGIILEQVFQRKEKPINSKLLLFIILFLGMLAFASIFLFWKYAP